MIIPQTRLQWVGFAIWFICNALVEYWFGIKRPFGAASVIELALIGVLNLFRRKK